MTEKARKALEKSIRHWERLLLNRDTVMGPDSCALCKEYNHDPKPCHGCPVMAKTGEQYCVGTPYKNAAAGFNTDVGVTSQTKAGQIWAELRFLRSLL